MTLAERAPQLKLNVCGLSTPGASGEAETLLGDGNAQIARLGYLSMRLGMAKAATRAGQTSVTTEKLHLDSCKGTVHYDGKLPVKGEDGREGVAFAVAWMPIWTCLSAWS